MIASLRAFTRLLMRPASLAMLYLLSMAAISPSLFDDFHVGGSLGVSGSSRVLLILWGEVMLFMTVFGVSLVTVEQAIWNPFAAAVPRLSQRAALGRWIYGVTAAFVLAGAIATHADAISFAPAFASSLMFFAVGGWIAEPVTSRSIAKVIGVALLVASLLLGRLVPFVEYAPIPVAIIAGAITVTLALRDRSGEVRRSRLLAPKMPNGYALGAKLDDGPHVRGAIIEWRGAPRSGRITEWLRAIEYESFGARRYGSIVHLGWFTLYASVAGYLIGAPAFAAILGIATIYPGLVLAGQWPYPLDREKRATIIYINGVMRYSAYFAVAGLLSWLLSRTHIPRFALGEAVAPYGRGLAIFVGVFAWTPLVQWLSIKWGINRRMFTSGAIQFRMLAVVLIAITLGMPSGALIEKFFRNSVMVQAGLLSTLVVATHLWYWGAIRRYYRVADLV